MDFKLLGIEEEGFSDDELDCTPTLEEYIVEDRTEVATVEAEEMDSFDQNDSYFSQRLLDDLSYTVPEQASTEEEITDFSTETTAYLFGEESDAFFCPVTQDDTDVYADDYLPMKRFLATIAKQTALREVRDFFTGISRYNN